MYSWPMTSLHARRRGVTVLLHGLNETQVCSPIPILLHLNDPSWAYTQGNFVLPFDSGRYSNFAKKLNANGFKVYGIDWIGKLISHFSTKYEWLKLSANALVRLLS